jgi:hypothetical protein
MQMKLFIVISLIASVFFQNSKTVDMITNARKAARLFCVKNHFPPEKVQQIGLKPLLSVDTEKEGLPVHIFRWIGSGRGEYYVQVEVFKDKQEMLVYGGNGKKDFERETYPTKKEP